jgi:hypothetical protein
MRRLFAVLAALFLAVTLLPATPAHAAPAPDRFLMSTDWGHVDGSITWYNRSVGIQGRVIDDGSGGYTSVRFWFYTDADSLYGPSPTRTASSNEYTDFNFTQQGPAGGIWAVWVKLCTTGGDCREEPFYRDF